MKFLEDMVATVQRLTEFAELDVPTSELPAAALQLSDASVREALRGTAQIVRHATLLQTVLAGVASARSTRDRGHGGLVQEDGHRTAVEMIRDLTGTTRGEAVRAVKVGESLIDGLADARGRPAVPVQPAATDAGEPAPAADAAPWFQPLRDAVLTGALSTAQQHAIRNGLGEPPEIKGRAADEVADAWRGAAHALAGEAPHCTVEALGIRARALRDMLDPMGAEDRFAVRYAQRSFRTYTGNDGLARGSIVFDDEAAHWLTQLMNAALSPRRGGPRFVSDDERAQGELLERDPRTNDQLSYDLLLDLLRSGATSSHDDLCGGREAGVRLVTTAETIAEPIGATEECVCEDDGCTDPATAACSHGGPGVGVRDAFGRLVGVAQSEDGSLSVPGSVLERAVCTTGTINITVDERGNPLDVGRERRLFSRRQRLALAIRDGGCRWPGCDRPPSMCEAHHRKPWAKGGRTDIDDGILLCRYHHLHLHHNGWRITRRGSDFILHPPPGSGRNAVLMRSASPLRWMWDPPPDRPGWRTASAPTSMVA